MGSSSENEGDKAQAGIFAIANQNEGGRKDDEEADFETAIEAAGFGKFNVLLFFIAIPCCWTSLFEATTMSFVFPAAQCDLNLSLDNKGMLNAVTYSGMICSGFIWGYLVDSLGRRKLLILGYFLDFCLCVINGFTQSFEMLVASKFFGGLIINGPGAALTSYLSEFHYARYRSRVPLAVGLIYNIGYIIMPLGAWAILPQDFHFTLLGGKLEMHSWNVYLLICSVPSLIAFLLFAFVMPESAKFLMTSGRRDEALAVFRKVYSINTGKPAETYPIRALAAETKGDAAVADGTKCKAKALRDGLREAGMLFRPPHVSNVTLMCVNQMCLYLGFHTLKLWLPQIFTAVNDYKFYNQGNSSNLCEMLDIVRPNVTDGGEIAPCTVNNLNDSVYINTTVVAITSIICYVVAGFVINVLGKKFLIFILTITAGFLGISIYFAQDTISTLLITSLYVSVMGVAIDIIIGVIIDAFPTTLRTMSLSMITMFGRMGAMSGNLIFPVLLNIGCLPPFLMIGLFPIVCAFLSTLLPKTDLKPLQ